jgi:hypothetical protein
MGLADTAPDYRGACLATCDAAYNTFRRNVIYGHYTGPAIVVEEGASHTNIDHNTIVADGKSVSLEYPGASVGARISNNIWRGISAWGTGHESVNNYKVPDDLVTMFVNPEEHDYRLKPGPWTTADESGAAVGAIPFEEEPEMATIRKTITAVVEATISLLQPVTDGPVEVHSKVGTGPDVKQNTFTVDDSGQLVKT